MFRGRSNALAFLGLPSGASDDNAKKAYRKMALRMHPNQGGSTANFQKLGAAIDMVRGAVRFQPENGPAQPQARPQPRPEDPRPQRPTVRVMVTGVPGPLENTTKDLVFLPGQAPTLGTVLDRIPQEIPAFAEYLKNGLHAHRATMYLGGAVVKAAITDHGERAPLLGTGLMGTTVFLMLEARKPGQAKSGWMFLGENANAYRRRSAAEADERKKKKNAKRNADAAKARASAGASANNNGPAEYKVYVWNVRNMDDSGPARTPIAIKEMTFGVKPTVLQVIERIAGGSDGIRRMAEKGYLAFDKPYALRPSNFKHDPIKDVRKTLAPKFFHLIVRKLHDKNTYDMKWKKLTFDANAEARARARERFGGNANAEAAKARANAEAAKARANAEAAKAKANAEAARARANADAAKARANAEAKARANAEAAKAKANAEAAKAKANADAKAAKARANADAEAARARANADKADARARAENRARNMAQNEADARERANDNVIEVDFWDGVSVRPTSGAGFAFPAGTRPTIGMLVQRFAAEPEFFDFLKDGFRVIKFSKAWHPKYKGKGFDALLGPENNAAANASRRVIVLARQPKQRKEGWMYLPGSTPKPTKKKAPKAPSSRGPTPPPMSRGPMSENAAARVIQRFARRRVLPMKNAEGTFFTGFENKRPISRKYMIAIRGKLYDARNIMREVDQKYDDPHAIAMQDLYKSLSDAEQMAVARRAGAYDKILQNSEGDPQKFIKAMKNMGMSLDKAHYDEKRGGETPLHDAILGEDVPMVRALLEAGASPNVKMNVHEDKKSPLHLATAHVRNPSKRLEIVNLLLQYGAKPNARTTQRETPLVAAIYKAKDADVVRALLAAGAKPDEYMRIGEIRDFSPAIYKVFTNAGFR